MDLNEGKGSGRIVCKVDPEIADLIPRYLENRREEIGKILQAMRSADYETIRIIGHSLKGTGGGYGLDPISEIGQSLEVAAKKGNAEAIERCVRELADFLDRVEIVSEEADAP